MSLAVGVPPLVLSTSWGSHCLRRDCCRPVRKTAEHLSPYQVVHVVAGDRLIAGRHGKAGYLAVMPDVGCMAGHKGKGIVKKDLRNVL